MRLIYRAISALRARRAASLDAASNEKGKQRQTASDDCFLDDRSVTELVAKQPSGKLSLGTAARDG